MAVAGSRADEDLTVTESHHQAAAMRERDRDPLKWRGQAADMCGGTGAWR